MPLDQLQRLVRHHSYKVRAQAANALRIKGELATLEGLLRDPDPRLRRAALDGINDWRYFFAKGKETLTEEQFTPKMIAAITAMLRQPAGSNLRRRRRLVRHQPDAGRGDRRAGRGDPAVDQAFGLVVASCGIRPRCRDSQRDPSRYAKVVPTLTELMVAKATRCHAVR